jgi:hypothetical protein
MEMINGQRLVVSTGFTQSNRLNHVGRMILIEKASL